MKHKVLVFPGLEDCYVYKRPNSSVWQYYLSIPGEGDERKSTKVKGDVEDIAVGQAEAVKFAIDRKLLVMSRQQQGLKARRVKKMFDFIQEYLDEEEKRIADFNRPGFITKETFRVKRHHLNLLKKFYHNKSIKLEELDYPKLHHYPTWRLTVDPTWNPTPPKTNHTVNTELTTIRSYFSYLMREGYIPQEPTFVKVPRESLKNNRRDYLSPRQYTQTINTLRKWSTSQNATRNQQYNRRMVYLALLVMSNSCLRIGELRGLRWFDIEVNPNLPKEDQKIGHLIRIRSEITKTGQPRTVQTPTVDRFNEIRELSGIPKESRSHFPHVPPEFRGHYVFSKFGKPDQPLGQGTWDRIWKEIKELCSDRYWNGKNITYYSFRHTGISFAVSRGVPMLLLTRNCGTGSRYLEEVYYHHESESKETWETLNQNRDFKVQLNLHKDDMLIPVDFVMDAVLERMKVEA